MLPHMVFYILLDQILLL